MKHKAETFLSSVFVPSAPLVLALPTIFFLANVFRMVTELDLPYLIVMLAVGIYGLLFMLYHHWKQRKMTPIIVIFATFTLFSLVNLFAVGNTDIGSVITELMMFGVVFLLLIQNGSPSITQMAFYFVAAFFSIYWAMNISPQKLLSSSINYVSVVLLLSVALYYISLERNHHGKPDTIWEVLPAVVCFLLSLWGTGRSGILASGLLLVCIVLLYLVYAPASRKFFSWWKAAITGSNTKLKLAGFGLIGCIAAFLVLAVLNSQDLLLLLGKFAHRGFDNSAREEIWNSYLYSCFHWIPNLLLGAPVEEIPEVVAYVGNLHNSFLQYHAEHGIIVFLLVIALVIYAAIYYIRKRMYLHLLILAVIVLRGFFDKFLSMQYGTPVLLYLALYPILFRNYKKAAIPVPVTQEEL